MKSLHPRQSSNWDALDGKRAPGSQRGSLDAGEVSADWSGGELEVMTAKRCWRLAVLIASARSVFQRSPALIRVTVWMWPRV